MTKIFLEGFLHSRSLPSRVLLLCLIVSPAFCAIIRCDFTLGDLFIVGSRYACKVASIQNPETAEITQITGNHLANRTNANVEAFRIFQGLHFFPKNLTDLFPNLVYIEFTECPLMSISAADLAPWPNLRVLIANKNKIETLDGDLFKHSSNLTWIAFYGNPIQKIGANLLSYSSEWKYADFRKVSCVDTLAESAQQINDLKVQILRQCPGECTARCSIEKETDDLKSLANEQSTTIGSLRDSSVEQKAQLDNQAARIDDLEILTKAQEEKIQKLNALTENQAQMIEDLTSLAEEQFYIVGELYTDFAALRSKFVDTEKMLARHEICFQYCQIWPNFFTVFKNKSQN